MNLEKFVWVHADSEPDLDFHREVMRMGAYMEFDSIGNPEFDLLDTAKKLMSLIQTNKGNRILLSHDAGWYQPGQPNGLPEHGIRGFTSISYELITLLQKKGLDEQAGKLLTEINPKRAFAMHVS